MGRDNSNAGQRVLQARSYLKGSDDSLSNIIGVGLPDGAMCYVVEKQANYRFLKNSSLDPDGEIVIGPAGPDGCGRWVRESGTVGFALLSGGMITSDNNAGAAVARYVDTRLVQFALESETGILVYTGAVPRMALVTAHAHGATVTVFLNDGSDGAWRSASGVVELKTGSRLRLLAELGDQDPITAQASLQVVLL